MEVSDCLHEVAVVRLRGRLTVGEGLWTMERLFVKAASQGPDSVGVVNCVRRDKS